MCGIVGYFGNREARFIMLEGLERLEYRGYDSAGIAVINNFGKIETRRKAGKLANLAADLGSLPIYGTIGIGHTRWATHGAATERNAHPHVCGQVAVVHNGIITNHTELRAELEAQGAQFSSDTDTEVIPQLIDRTMREGFPLFINPVRATREAIGRLTGSFALAIIFEEDDTLVAACRNSPLVIGLTEHGTIVASDEAAFAGFTDCVMHLEDGDIAFINDLGISIMDTSGEFVEREVTTANSFEAPDKGIYSCFTEKEIFEQPDVILQTIKTPQPILPFATKDIKRAWIIGCGTSMHAGLAMQPLFEELWQIPVTCQTASEFSADQLLFAPNEAGIFLSQSGETADTLAALRLMKEKGCPTLAIVNRRGSQIARLADAVMYLSVGPEIGVASTKAFTAQLVLLIWAAMGDIDFYQNDIFRQWKDARGLGARFRLTRELPNHLRAVLELAPQIEQLAAAVSQAAHIMYIGRGTNYPICLEGALKMKELSYIHAEAFPAGELKHGSLALIDEHAIVVALAPRDQWFDKTASNIHEVAARGGKVIVISDREGCASLAGIAWQTIELPSVDPLIMPMVSVVALQLLAFYSARTKGNDIDKPRNLAKSVTVE